MNFLDNWRMDLLKTRGHFERLHLDLMTLDPDGYEKAHPKPEPKAGQCLTVQESVRSLREPEGPQVAREA